MNTEKFEHHHTAHCESGVTSNLLRHKGYEVSEAMAFGIGSGLFFMYMPFLKVMEVPLTTYRSFPGTIFKKTCKRLNIRFAYQNFRDPIHGTKALDRHLAEGRSVGIRGNIYWLPYIPEKFRFQFNAHNLVVVDKSPDGDYLVSDPILETTALCPSKAMTKSRFSKGPLRPKGLLFYPLDGASPADLPWSTAIHSGVRETVNTMLFSPIWCIGVAGIRFLSRQIRQWPHKIKDEAKLKLYMSNVVRMQEEIGTGGAGFRYLYGAFLQEAAQRTDNEELNVAALKILETGNTWRDFATLAARFCKDRLDVPYDEIPKTLLHVADQEESIYRRLKKNYL